MTWLHAGQLCLAGIAFGLAFRSIRELLFTTALDTRPYLEAVSEALVDGSPAFLSLIDLAPRSALARLARAAWVEDGDETEVVLAELRHEATVGVAPLRAVARISSPLAFLAVMVEMGLAMGGGHGLAALQRGLPQQLAIEYSALSVAIGVATSVLSLSAASMLQRAARQRLADLRLASEIIDTARQCRAET